MDKIIIVINLILLLVIIVSAFIIYNKSHIDLYIDKEIVSSNDHKNALIFTKKKLKFNHGVLFIYPRLLYNSFWMKNIYIPLDIICLDEKLQVVGLLENLIPLDTNNHEIKNKFKYALKVNSGTIKRMNIQSGNYIILIKKKKN